MTAMQEGPPFLSPQLPKLQPFTPPGFAGDSLHTSASPSFTLSCPPGPYLHRSFPHPLATPASLYHHRPPHPVSYSVTAAGAPLAKPLV